MVVGESIEDNSTASNDKQGITIKINNHNDFITNVNVSPISKKWFKELVQDVLDKYDCGDIKVKQSELISD